eukprot:569409-Hanusia_phi.AAC.1
MWGPVLRGGASLSGTHWAPQARQAGRAGPGPGFTRDRTEPGGGRYPAYPRQTDRKHRMTQNMKLYSSTFSIITEITGPGAAACNSRSTRYGIIRGR